ncbi:MAG: hypothetical protein JXB32_11615 [Deltaproteobacteria bacterium]|nr:hypothetical protein [Deltaproteobacteria bacterium]
MIDLLIAVFFVHFGIVALVLCSRGARVVVAGIVSAAVAYVAVNVGLIFYGEWAASDAIHGDPSWGPLTTAAGILVPITLHVAAPMLTVQRLSQGRMPRRTHEHAGTFCRQGVPNAGA